jgi:Ca-activated chloride channel homolog
MKYGTWVLGLTVVASATALACGSSDEADVGSDSPGAYNPASTSKGGGTSYGGSTSKGVGATGNTDAEEDPDYESGSGGEGSVAEPEEEPLGINPFVMVGHDPLSTFGADVDSASYDIFRQYVNAGQLPDPDGVRLEEYVNAFTYDYVAPTADAKHPFSISLGAAPSLFEYDTTILRIGIQGAPAPAEQKPANVVFLVDVSGSMSEELPLVQQVLTTSVDQLALSDTIAIVTYAGSTEVRLEPTAVADADTIKAAIANLASGGSTAGAAGIDLAYEQAQAGFIEGGINHVILCTDGDFNVGPYSTSELVDLIVEKRQTGITLTALGFGIGNNDSMMEAVSNAGNGIYRVISSSEQATSYVEERMLTDLVHIAKDMKIQVEFNPEHVLAYRLLGYEDRAIADQDFRNDVVDAGEVGAGHRVTALYELVRAGSAVPDVEGVPAPEDGAAYDGAIEISPEDLVLVKVRYKQPGASETDAAFEVASSLAPDAIAASAAELDADFQWALSIASFAEILKQSPYASAERLPQIEALVTRPAHAEFADRAEFVQLFAAAKPLLPASP